MKHKLFKQEIDYMTTFHIKKAIKPLWRNQKLFGFVQPFTLFGQFLRSSILVHGDGNILWFIRFDFFDLVAGYKAIWRRQILLALHRVFHLRSLCFLVWESLIKFYLFTILPPPHHSCLIKRVAPYICNFELISREVPEFLSKWWFSSQTFFFWLTSSKLLKMVQNRT